MLHSLLHCSNREARDSAPGGPTCTGATPRNGAMQRAPPAAGRRV